MINKNSTIEIEVRKKPDDEIVLSRQQTHYTIENLLAFGLIFGDGNKIPTYIETLPIWTDEYKLSPIADIFLANNFKTQSHNQDSREHFEQPKSNDPKQSSNNNIQPRSTISRNGRFVRLRINLTKEEINECENGKWKNQRKYHQFLQTFCNQWIRKDLSENKTELAAEYAKYGILHSEN